jgi:hypothetical protein
MPVLDSEMLIAAYYNDERRELTAIFHPDGRTYIYSGVPRREFDGLLAADSHGTFFNANIRDHYPFRELRR